MTESEIGPTDMHSIDMIEEAMCGCGMPTAACGTDECGCGGVPAVIEASGRPTSAEAIRTAPGRKAGGMQTAFEVTPDDVRAVASLNGLRLSEEEAQIAFDRYVAPEGGRVERAALYGSSIEEQTHYAHREIRNLLGRAGLISWMEEGE